MLILLPPSEGKAAPGRGRPLDLGSLSFPSLNEAREQVIEPLVSVSGSSDGPSVLGLGPTQHDLLERNLALRTSPTARADRVYTGVLYDALGFGTLSTAALRRAAARVAVTSSVFGLVRPGDRIPAYRLSGDATLPGLGPGAGVWRAALGPAVEEAVGTGLLVDLRSSTYAAFWRATRTTRLATVRVLHETGGKRQVVSHFNKATKGRIVQALLEDGGNPRTPAALADLLGALGWTVERDGSRLDVVVTDL